MSINPADAHKLPASVSCWTIFLGIFMTFNYLLVEMLKRKKKRHLCSKHLCIAYICVTRPASPVFRVEVSPSKSAEQSLLTRERPQPGPDSTHQTRHVTNLF